MFNYYPKNFKANGWGWHRSANAASAVKGFLKGERGEGTEPLLGNGSLYPKLPTADDTMFSTSMRLYPALPAEEYESGAVEEVVEESCAAVNVSEVVWNVWVAKVKTKARKVRDSIRVTGGGPARAGLTDMDSKVLDIIGSASVNGFSNLEVGITESSPPRPLRSPVFATYPHVEVESRSPPASEVAETSGNRTGAMRRRRFRRVPRPPVHANLVQALNENSRLLRETIIQAAEILASALRPANVPVVQNGNEEM